MWETTPSKTFPASLRSTNKFDSTPPPLQEKNPWDTYLGILDIPAAHQLRRQRVCTLPDALLLSAHLPQFFSQSVDILRDLLRVLWRDDVLSESGPHSLCVLPALKRYIIVRGACAVYWRPDRSRYLAIWPWRLPAWACRLYMALYLSLNSCLRREASGQPLPRQASSGTVRYPVSGCERKYLCRA